MKYQAQEQSFFISTVVPYIKGTGIEREMKDKMGESLRVRRASLIIIFFLLSVIDAEAINITAAGSCWYRTISKVDLQSGAGSGLNSTYESTPDATVLDIEAGKKTQWAVYVRTAPSWVNDITLYVRRISDGKGGGTVEGGTSYVSVGPTDVQLFSGKGPRMGINLQYKLTGISIRIPVGTYSRTLIYTVEEIR